MAYGKMAFLYDRLMADMPYDRWVDLVVGACRSSAMPIRHVVDLGCGTGECSIPLAAAGFRVTGIDRSEEMLSVAAGKAVDLAGGTVASSLRWVHQDMREWELGEAADAVVSLCDCLNYVTEERDAAAVLEQTFRQLKPGGFFLFDVLTEAQFEDYEANQPFYLNEEDLAYIWTCEWQPELSSIEHEITFFVADGSGRFERFDETHRQRAYRAEWLLERLERAGFSEIETFGDFERGPIDDRTRRAFFLARKPESAVD